MRHKLLVVGLIGLCLAVAGAKEPTEQIVVWPENGKPLLRFTFGKLKEGAAYGREHSYTCETTAQNLWEKKLAVATFTLYVFDKANVRIGEGFLQVNNMGPGETIKFQTTFHATGSPATIKLIAETVPTELQSQAPPPSRTISITINTVPQGAIFKLDGSDSGTTPKIVRVSAGRHMLEFSKEGFNPGRFPLEIGSDDASGGSVSYELGTLAHDTVDLRDGTVLVCDVESMSSTEAVLRIGGALQRMDRNKIKRVLLVERDTPKAR